MLDRRGRSCFYEWLPYGGKEMKDTEKADSLRAQVYQRLRSALRKGLVGSNRTATERDLAEQLGVSRTPVREALMILEHEGLVSATTRGFTSPQLSARDISNLYEIRRLLEPAALATTVDHLSAHDLRSLRQFLSEQESADSKGDVEAFMEANANFRAVWLQAIPNTQLRKLIERHDDHVNWLRQVTLDDGKIRKKVIGNLRNILTALQAGKPAAAAAAMLTHMENAETALTAAVNDARRDNAA
jgi:DNA-binding GntR family transcriptional regulator